MYEADSCLANNSKFLAFVSLHSSAWFPPLLRTIIPALPPNPVDKELEPTEPIIEVSSSSHSDSPLSPSSVARRPVTYSIAFVNFSMQASHTQDEMAQVENSKSTTLHHNSTPHDQLTIQHPSPLPYKSSMLRRQFPFPTEASHVLHSSTIGKSFNYNHPSSQPARMTDISYPESYLRTPIYALPFLHPKWHAKTDTREFYEVTSPIWEEHDAEAGYVNSVEEVKESVEGCNNVESIEGKSQKDGWRKTKRSLDSIDGADDDDIKRKRFRDA